MVVGGGGASNSIDPFSGRARVLSVYAHQDPLSATRAPGPIGVPTTLDEGRLY